jgi:two-component system chemotaxis response regulator CheY
VVKKILAVDDSRTMREMVSYTLKRAGFEVIEAEDGNHALSVLNSSAKVDAVISDLNMPHMDGIGLISALRADPRYKSTPILILSTESDPVQKEHAKSLGATGWLLKPFNPETLVQVMHKVCS